jgi:hypothetical protein
VFAVDGKLLRQVYIIGVDSYFSGPQLCDMLNDFERDEIGTVRSNRKELLRDIMGRKLKKGEVEIYF